MHPAALEVCSATPVDFSKARKSPGEVCSGEYGTKLQPDLALPQNTEESYFSASSPGRKILALGGQVFITLVASADRG